MDKTELSFWLAMGRMSELKTSSVQRLLESMPVEAFFKASVATLVSMGLAEEEIHALQHPDWESVEKDLQWLSKPENDCLTLIDSDYPPSVLMLAEPPLILYLKGNKDLLTHRSLVMTGSQQPTVSGTRTATEFAGAISKGTCLRIISGLSPGIEVACHQGVLKVGSESIAVLSHGLSIIYPEQHRSLARQIARTGLLVTCFPPDRSYSADNLPERNILLAALSVGVLVVEASVRCSSLQTAYFALEMNREVFAIPGSIHSPVARGCNALIRHGAKLVETVGDIEEELDQYNQSPRKNCDHFEQTGLDLEHEKLLNLIGNEPISIDYLVQKSGLSVEMISSILLVLELQGYVATASLGSYIRT